MTAACGEHARLVLDGQARQQVVARPLVLGALQLARGDRLLAQAIELGGERLDRGVGRLPRLDDGRGEEQVGVLDDVAAAERRQRQPLLVDQRPVDARAVAVRQHLVDDVQRIAVRVAVEGDVVGDDDRRQRHVLVDGDAALGGRSRLGRDVARHRLLRLRHAAEVALHHLHRRGRVEIAGDDEHGVLRHVVGLVEVAHVLDARRLEVGHAADHLVLVGVGRERRVVDDLGEASVGRAVDALPALFLHHAALARERRLLDLERGHPIGLEPQRQRQVVRRHRLPVVGRILVGRGVALAADRGDERLVLILGDVLAALEHQVLEEVREPGPAGLLVLRADVVGDADVDDGRRVVLVEDDPQAVLELRRRVDQRRRTLARRGVPAAPAATAASPRPARPPSSASR